MIFPTWSWSFYRSTWDSRVLIFGSQRCRSSSSAWTSLHLLESRMQCLDGYSSNSCAIEERGIHQGYQVICLSKLHGLYEEHHHCSIRGDLLNTLHDQPLIKLIYLQHKYLSWFIQLGLFQFYLWDQFCFQDWNQIHS